MIDHQAASGFLRDYRNAPGRDKCACCPEGWHRNYRGNLHNSKDEKVDAVRQLWRTLDAIPEGNRVEIIVRDLGVRDPLADDPWVLLKPHEYGPMSKLGAQK